VEIALGARSLADPARGDAVSPLIALAIAQPTACGYWRRQIARKVKKP
jgi:hypothetical protein